MKRHASIAVSALVLAVSSQSSFAELSLPLPEFKSKAELQRAASSKQNMTPESTETSTFYTGKPYEANGENYLFKYRNYDPGLNRWTTIDPSGFPDGANNVKYAPSPTAEFDFQGLFTVSGTKSGSTLNVSYGGSNYTIQTYNITEIAPQAGASLSGNMSINTYKANDWGGGSGGGELNITMDNIPAPAQGVEYHWIQTITTTHPYYPGTTPYTPYKDNAGGSTDFYDDYYTADAGYFYDFSTRPYAYANTGPVIWYGNLVYVGYNTSSHITTNYGGITWSWSIVE